MEIKTELRTFRVEKQCDECSNGTMIATGKGSTTPGGTGYGHRCNYCGSLRDFETVYPTVLSEPIPNTEKVVKDTTPDPPAAPRAPRKTAAPKKAAEKKSSKK